ncbi:MAG: hypothetical protein JXJ17_16020 [Anaerolineae bacterium]|nr:hypothetical protein [Anaerolineae bacterium]
MGEDKQSSGSRPNTGWEERLNQSGLGGLALSIIHAMRPVAPIAANLLWIVQPAFAVFGRAEEIEALANRLSDSPGEDGMNQPPPGSG